MPYDYERDAMSRTAAEKESVRLKKLSDELRAMGDRLREIAGQLPIDSPEMKKKMRGYTDLYDVKRLTKKLTDCSTEVESVGLRIKDGIEAISTFET